MVQINWTNQAVSDLQDIVEYISKDSIYYAKLQIIRIKTKPQILLKQMNAGSIVPEFNRKDIRQLIEGNYRIIYKVVNETRVDILTIHHAARDLKQRDIL